MLRSASEAPSAMVILSVEALAIARVPQPKACPINSKFVFVRCTPCSRLIAGSHLVESEVIYICACHFSVPYAAISVQLGVVRMGLYHPIRFLLQLHPVALTPVNA